MKNVNVTVSSDGKKLKLEIDLTQEYGPSSSGKNVIVASSEGNQAIGKNGEIKFGLNVFKAPKKG